MDDKELVEVWRKEFLELYQSAKQVPYSPAHGFMDYETDNVWHGFKLAKRTQPSVVLPSINECEGILFVEDDYYHATEIHAALTAAGIKYTIGE